MRGHSSGQTLSRGERQAIMDTVDLVAQVNSIRSRADFVSFIYALSKDLHDNPQRWENDDLESFLKALAAWIEDMDGFYKNQGLPVPSQLDWKILGDIFMAATMYE
jgi:hypothetical protein